MGEVLGKLIGLVVESVLMGYGAYSLSKKAIDKLFEEEPVEMELNEKFKDELRNEFLEDYELMREGIGA